MLTVSGTACRSIADLIDHLRSKLDIPRECEFAIFTDDVGDGACADLWHVADAESLRIHLLLH